MSKNVIQTRLVESDNYNTTPLLYPATQSLLLSPLKPQLYTSPKTHTHTTNTSPTRYKYGNGKKNISSGDYSIITYL